jgi:hypothetical protein
MDLIQNVTKRVSIKCIKYIYIYIFIYESKKSKSILVTGLGGL